MNVEPLKNVDVKLDESPTLLVAVIDRHNGAGISKDIEIAIRVYLDSDDGHIWRSSY
jgi:hypothetical protein